MESFGTQSLYLGLWNEEQRFVSLPLTKDSVVVYVGANTEGRDGKTIMDMFGWSVDIEY